MAKNLLNTYILIVKTDVSISDSNSEMYSTIPVSFSEASLASHYFAITRKILWFCED